MSAQWARSNDIVYEAYDPLMNRRVALKELAMPGGLNDSQREDRRNRFLREARAAGTLTHPNIVTVYEYGEDSGKHYIAMEFLDGHTLRNELDTHGFLPLDRCLEIAKAVLDALEYAHKNGVIHRDIKPENIQLMGDGLSGIDGCSPSQGDDQIGTAGCGSGGKAAHFLVGRDPLERFLVASHPAGAKACGYVRTAEGKGGAAADNDRRHPQSRCLGAALPDGAGTLDVSAR